MTVGVSLIATPARFTAVSITRPMAFDVGPEGYGREQAESFFDQLTERAASIPGAESATVTGFVPFGLGGFFRTVYLPGQEEGGENARAREPHGPSLRWVLMIRNLRQAAAE